MTPEEKEALFDWLDESGRPAAPCFAGDEGEISRALRDALRVETLLRQRAGCRDATGEIIGAIRNLEQDPAAAAQARERAGFIVPELPAPPPRVLTHRSVQRAANVHRSVAARAPARRPASRWMLSAFILVALLGAGLWWREDQSTPRLVPGTTAASLVRQGRVQLVSKPARLRAGDIIRTQAQPGARISYPSEGTELRLSGSTEVAILASQSGKFFRLERGGIECKAERQPPGKPLKIETPSAIATIVGTRFRLSHREASTWLEVREGAVSFAKPNAASPVTISAGEYAAATPDTAPEPRPLPRDGVLRVPMELRWQPRAVDGDGDWQESGASILQRRISDIPPSESRSGTPRSANSGLRALVLPGDGILIEARIDVVASAASLKPPRSWPWGYGFRLHTRSHSFKFRTVHQPGRDLLRFDAVRFFPTTQYPEMTGLSRKDAAGLRAPVRMKFSAERLDPQRLRLRGKCWPAAAAEPEAWTLSAELACEEHIQEAWLDATYASLRFSEIRAWRCAPAP